MEPRNRYRLLLGSHGRFENGKQVIYRARAEGRDLIDLTDTEARMLGSRVERVEDSAAKATAPVGATTAPKAEATPAATEAPRPQPRVDPPQQGRGWKQGSGRR